MRNYDSIETLELLDTLPQNLPLYKDSGLWQVRTDDMEDVVFRQTSYMSFRDFIVGYCKHLDKTDPNWMES